MAVIDDHDTFRNELASVAPDGRLTSNAARAGENEMFELVLLK